MHRKSLEAAEHIRKQDEKDLNCDKEINYHSLSPIESQIADESNESSPSSSSSSSSSSSPSSVTPSSSVTTSSLVCESANYSTTCNKISKIKKNDDLKSESVANLRAKAKEHSAKLMGDIEVCLTKTKNTFDSDLDIKPIIQTNIFESTSSSNSTTSID